MKKVSISDAKNRLSALLDHVRQGAAVTIEDRGVPVARLEPIVAAGVDPQGRLARLERAGIVRAPAAAVPAKVLKTRPPAVKGGRKASDAVIEERKEGR